MLVVRRVSLLLVSVCFGCVPTSNDDDPDATVIDLTDGAVGTDGTSGGHDGSANDMSAGGGDAGAPQCDDGEDNDGDGDVDLADDGCASAADDDESDEPRDPECSDGEDNDADGFTDFPRDPGCGSELDDDEGDDGGPGLPECGNGIDDDNDGRVDLADPGCVSPADPREADPDEPAACSDLLDNDADGITDFPLDPGCATAGDDTEEDRPVPPQCGNGLDDDGDGSVDYPDDPGCAGVGDGDETDPPVPPACADGVDNDRDGRVDYPDDRGCESAADGNEGGSCGNIYDPVEIDAGEIIRGDSRRGAYASRGSCGGVGAPEVVFVYRVARPIEGLRITTAIDGNEAETTLYVRRGCLDPNSEVACAREAVGDGEAANALVLDHPQPGDYYIFLDGAAGFGGDFALLVEEIALAACLNGIDDDEDNRVDYPVDPGCVEPEDRDETDPDVLPACADDEDNDGDGLIDYPLDRGCRSAADTDEVDLCGQGITIDEYPVGQPFVLGATNVDGSNAFSGSCGGVGAPEHVYVYRNPFNANLTFSVNHDETIPNTALYVRSGCQDPAAELGCSVGEGAERRGTVSLERVGAGELYVFVDALLGLGGAFKLSVEVERLPPSCSDGADNDGDGFIDTDDVGCAAADDEDERDPADGAPLPACWDGEDNDEDGVVDYPFDVGCFGKGDPDEADPDEPPQCANEIDDDEDEAIDFPSDRGCASRGDDDEEDPRAVAQCANRIDDDMDGLADYPVDPGCAGRGDPSERDDELAPACANQEDDDRDGLVDYPFDPGCLAAGHTTERDPDEPAACSNGLDDDEDGITDFPREPGCTFAADDDEADPAFPPQCANGMDDDANQRVDWPDDPGCRFAADTVERTDGPVLARCADGVDNDGDDLVDLADIGCVNARDDDEGDPEVPPFCADGDDNDEDGETDWPDDPGCAAQGDECEQAGFGFCEGVCQDLVSNVLHCGRCGRACSEGVECIEGRCGELREIVQLCARSGRDVNEFIRGDLAEAEIRVEDGCNGGPTVQAILVPRAGLAVAQQNIAAIRDYVETGGVVLTEYNISHTFYNAFFNANIPQGARNGSCRDNVQPVTQFSPQDIFWADNEFQPLPAQDSGCGFAVGHFPNLVPLGGWNPQNVSFGYVDVGNGRIWFIDCDWSDGDQNFTDVSRDLMAYMLAGGATFANLPPCVNGRDDDEDGLFDAEDPGCADADDEEEGDAPDGDAPACSNEVDDDDDGRVDFPFDVGCVMAGDDDEADPDDVPACANGADDDGDGEVDFPFDPGCQGRGDDQERDPVRRPRCGNARDDDEDGLVDFPADPGCSSAGDPDETDDLAQASQCANGIDDDRDGITDWPFDRGCQSARDDDERDPAERPQCANREDDDEDDLVDFPADPGCAFAADERERDPGNLPVCSNGADDDADGLVDYPADRGCRFAGDVSEVDPFDPPTRCEDGVDNDGDGLVDLSDSGCVNRDDDDEADPDDVPICANGRDDDEDGLEDWPADPGCQALGDDGEEQTCRDGVAVVDVQRNGRVVGATDEDGEDRYRNQCGGREAPDLVYRYVLGQRRDLTISADNEGTDFPVVLGVSRDCEEERALLACAGDFRNPEPVVRLANAEPGEYFIFVDGGGPERWVSDGRPLALPPDPRNFMSRHDLRADCGWSDGGNDAFDCYGRIVLTHNGQATGNLPIADAQGEGNRGAGNVGGYGYSFISDFPHQNVWRVQMLPAVENDERRVTVTISGNLGSDGGTVSDQRQLDFQGRRVPFLVTSDNFAAPRDPPVVHLLVPSDPDQLPAINYAIDRDNPTLTAVNVTLPVTFYVGLHYGDLNAAAAAIMQNIEVRAGGGGAEAPRFGNFELTVTEE